MLTNNPPFPFHLQNVNYHLHIGATNPKNTISPQHNIKPTSYGLSGVGLPGDFSSHSRFVRAVFVKSNQMSNTLTDAFHILGSVEQQRGCCDVGENDFEITIYTSCCNADKGIYYYTTYTNHCIIAVDMHRENLDSAGLITYPLLTGEQFKRQN